MNSLDPGVSEAGIGASRFVNDAGAQAYALARHGSDGAKLLDPVFTEYMRDACPGNGVIDIGFGAAPWAIEAKKYGAAIVRGFDNSPHMLDQARRAIAEAGMTGRITVESGTVKNLPVESGAFAVALSLNVGCALPSYEEDDEQGSGTLADHFGEMKRVLEHGGVAIVAAPVSLETPFTAYGKDEDAKLVAFDEALGEAVDVEAVKKAVGSNGDVLRATIIEGEGTFRIAQPEEVWIGRKVLRKIPGLVVPNYAHTEVEYETAITDAGLEIVEMKKPTLANEAEAQKLGLGRQYVEKNPFAIYLLRNVT